MSKYNIENYSTEELLNLFGLEEEELTQPNIESILTEHYNKIKKVVDNNTNSDTEQKLTYSNFLLEAKSKIIETINNKNKNKDVLLNSQWDVDKVNQFKKEWEQTVVDKIWIFDSQHRKKGALLPPPANGPPTTDYVYQFESEIRNVESIELISITIPASWYVFDSITKKNTVFKYTSATNDISFITIEDGTYDISGVLYQINKQVGNDMSFNLNPYSRKIDISCGVDLQIIFYDSKDLSFNLNNPTSNLGHLLGFRIENDSSGQIILDLSANKKFTASACYNLNGSKLFYIYMDEYAQKYDTTIAGVESVPSNTTNSIDKSNKYYIETKAQDCSYVMVAGVKTKLSHYSVYTPRTNTLKVIAAKDSKNIYNTLASSNTYSVNFDTLKQLSLKELFAIIPIVNYHNLFETNRNMVYFNDVLSNNKRLYKGTTHLQNFRIKLYDEDHNIVNLNGLDWCFTIKAHINSSSGITPN